MYKLYAFNMNEFILILYTLSCKAC